MMRKLHCFLTGCRHVRVPFSDARRWMATALSGSCVVPTLERCERCGHVQVTS